MFARWTENKRYTRDPDLPALEVLGLASGVHLSSNGPDALTSRSANREIRRYVDRAKHVLAYSPAGRIPEVANFMRDTIGLLETRGNPFRRRDPHMTLFEVLHFQTMQGDRARDLLKKHFLDDESKVTSGPGIIAKAQIVGGSGLRL
ncbi:MAG: hypothetical protein AAF556_00165 [Pseudomonadota bacterium]